MLSIESQLTVVMIHLKVCDTKRDCFLLPTYLLNTAVVCYNKKSYISRGKSSYVYFEVFKVFLRYVIRLTVIFLIESTLV